MNFTNKVLLVGHAMDVKILPSLEYNMLPIPRDLALYKFPQAIGPCLIKYHYRCSVCLPFLKENIKVVHAKLIPTSSTKG